MKPNDGRKNPAIKSRVTDFDEAKRIFEQCGFVPTGPHVKWRFHEVEDPVRFRCKLCGTNKKGIGKYSLHWRYAPHALRHAISDHGLKLRVS